MMTLGQAQLIISQENSQKTGSWAKTYLSDFQKGKCFSAREHSLADKIKLYCKNTGQCSVSDSRLATVLSCSTRHICNILKTLERKGIIARYTTKTGNGKGRIRSKRIIYFTDGFATNNRDKIIDSKNVFEQKSIAVRLDITNKTKKEEIPNGISKKEPPIDIEKKSETIKLQLQKDDPPDDPPDIEEFDDDIFNTPLPEVETSSKPEKFKRTQNKIKIIDIDGKKQFSKLTKRLTNQLQKDFPKIKLEHGLKSALKYILENKKHEKYKCLRISILIHFKFLEERRLELEKIITGLKKSEDYLKKNLISVGFSASWVEISGGTAKNTMLHRHEYFEDGKLRRRLAADIKYDLAKRGISTSAVRLIVDECTIPVFGITECEQVKKREMAKVKPKSLQCDTSMEEDIKNSGKSKYR